MCMLKIEKYAGPMFVNPITAEFSESILAKYYQLNVETAKVYDFQDKILQVYFEQRKSNLK